MFRNIKYASSVLLTAVFLLTASAFDLRNPALTPVRIRKAPRHEPLTLVENGKLRFAIVIDRQCGKKTVHKANMSVLPAAELLQEAFEKCTGEKPEVFDLKEMEQAKQKYPLLFFLGESEQTKNLGLSAKAQPVQGYEITTFPGGVAIVGSDSESIPGFPWFSGRTFRGTLWGAYDFAERILGCRFFFPGPYGSLWPKTGTLKLEPFHYSDAPRFIQRTPKWVYWCMTGEKNRKKWEPLLGKFIGKTSYPDPVPFFERWRMESGSSFWAGHAPNPLKLAKSYPDKMDILFFTSASGQRYYDPKGIGNYLNVVDLRLADLLIDSLKRFYASNGRDNPAGWPRATLLQGYIPFGQCDTSVPPSEMASHPIVVREKLLTPEMVRRGYAYSDIYGRFNQYFARRIKEEFPGKKLILMPYSNYTRAPLNPKWRALPDNVELCVCHYGMKKIRNRNIAETWKTIIREWQECLGGRPVAALWLYNVPGFEFARALAPSFAGDVVKDLGDSLGNDNLFIDQYGSLEWWYYYSNYAAAKAQWNPDFNVAAAMEEHWKPFYGKAAPYVKGFYDLLMEACLKYYMPSAEDTPLYPVSVYEKMENFLKQAKAAVPEESVEGKRVRLFRHPWEKAIQKQKTRLVYERPMYGVHQILNGEKVFLDFKKDAAFWKGIAPMEMRDPRGTDDKPQFPVTAKLAWDGNGIYGYMRMQHPPKVVPGKGVWTNCSVEILISPGLEKSHLFHYAADPLNNLHFGTQEFIPVRKPYNGKWSSPGFRSIAEYDENSWRFMFFIPYADLNRKTPKPYDSWLINIVRNKAGDPKEYSGTAMTLGNNHNMNMYGFIRFLGKGE